MINPGPHANFVASAIAVFAILVGCSLEVRQSAAPSQRSRVGLSDCQFASYATKALCGKLEVFEDQKSQTGRRIVYPDLEANLVKALASLERQPATLTLAHPKTKILQTVVLTRSVFADRLRNLLYNGSTTRLLPLIIQRAAREDWTIFAKVVTRISAAAHHTPAMGLYLTVTCSESIPLISDDEIARETSDTFLGEYRVQRHQATCREWPRGEVPDSFYAPVHASVPILMLAGELDGATPARFGSDASKSLSNSRQVLLPDTAHDYSSGCARALISEFIATAATAGLNTSCVEGLRHPPFARELSEQFAR